MTTYNLSDIECDNYEDVREITRVSKYNDEELIRKFNKEVWNSWSNSTRSEYLSKLHKEFDKRWFDYSKIWNKKTLSFKDKIYLVNTNWKKSIWIDYDDEYKQAKEKWYKLNIRNHIFYKMKWLAKFIRTEKSSKGYIYALLLFIILFLIPYLSTIYFIKEVFNSYFGYEDFWVVTYIVLIVSSIYLIKISKIELVNLALIWLWINILLLLYGIYLLII